MTEHEIEVKARELIDAAKSLPGDGLDHTLVPLGKPVAGYGIAASAGVVAVERGTEFRDMVIGLLESELCTEESTDILIRVITAPLPPGIRTVVSWALDRVLPEYAIKAIKAVLYRDIAPADR